MRNPMNRPRLTDLIHIKPAKGETPIIVEMDWSLTEEERTLIRELVELGKLEEPTPR
jgi:hypothetical protein